MTSAAFEENLGLEEKRRYASSYGLRGSYFTDWLLSFLQELRGIPTVFDYATRVCMAEKLLDNVNPEHKKAAKHALETVLLNLSPNAQQVMLATRGNAARGEDEIMVLDDEVAENRDAKLVKMRYALMTRALELYCDLGFEDIRTDLEEEDVSEFPTWYEQTMTKVPELRRILADARRELYVDFPEFELQSIEPEVIGRRLHEYQKNENVDKSSKGQRLEEQITSLEHQVAEVLRSIITNAATELRRLRGKRDGYLGVVRNMRVLKNMLKEYLDNARAAEIDHNIEEFDKMVRETFSDNKIFPEKVLQDLKEGRTTHSG